MRFSLTSSQFAKNECAQRVRERALGTHSSAAVFRHGHVLVAVACFQVGTPPVKPRLTAAKDTWYVGRA